MVNSNLIRRVLFKGLENGYIICDIPVGRGRSKEENVLLKIADDTELLERFKQLPKRRLIWITYTEEIFLGITTDDVIVTHFMINDEYMVLYKEQQERQKELDKKNRKELLKELRGNKIKA